MCLEIYWSVQECHSKFVISLVVLFFFSAWLHTFQAIGDCCPLHKIVFKQLINRLRPCVLQSVYSLVLDGVEMDLWLLMIGGLAGIRLDLIWTPRDPQYFVTAGSSRPESLSVVFGLSVVFVVVFILKGKHHNFAEKWVCREFECLNRKLIFSLLTQINELEFWSIVSTNFYVLLGSFKSSIISIL